MQRALRSFGHQKQVVRLEVLMPHLETDLSEHCVGTEQGNASGQQRAQAGCTDVLLVVTSGVPRRKRT